MRELLCDPRPHRWMKEIVLFIIGTIVLFVPGINVLYLAALGYTMPDQNYKRRILWYMLLSFAITIAIEIISLGQDEINDVMTVNGISVIAFILCWVLGEIVTIWRKCQHEFSKQA